MFHSLRKAATGVAALAALALGGAAIADAASSTTTATSTKSSAGTSQRWSGQARPQMPAPGTASHEDAEKTVTGAAAAKAQAAAVKSVGGGTTGTVTTDYLGHGYEVVVTKAGGQKVEVHLDSSFNVMAGPPGGPGRPGGMTGPPPARQ